MIALPPYIIYILSFVIALTISTVSIPRIIYITKRKRLFDVPDNSRKIHVNIIPNLGGVAIFFAYIIVSCFFLNHLMSGKWNFIIASSILLFLTGLNDDLVNMRPSAKFMAQLVAAVITVCFASDIRITSLHGLFGITDLPYWFGIAFTTVGCVFVTNAFNLIDGIDGLAGSIGVLSTLLLGIGLAMLGNVGAACMSFSLMGATIGFLRYNISPAKIFMGDTGSLLLGFTISVLSILFIHSYNASNNPIYTQIVHSHKAATMVALSILFVPVFDSFRVFVLRISKRSSPFKADRSHLHHYLLDAGFTHSQSVAILLISNILIITVTLIVQDANPNVAMLCILAVAFSLFGILHYVRKKRLAQNMELIARRMTLERNNNHTATAPQAVNGKKAPAPSANIAKGISVVNNIISEE
jgi:UDP-GlcNAc:undecaprenyl-phosphate/decaprenyl-phosphate GlcNAc-1-phosphate transferase